MKCFISVFPNWLYSLNCFLIWWLIVNDNLAGIRITTKAHLWLCLHGSFQKSLTEKIPPWTWGWYCSMSWWPRLNETEKRSQALTLFSLLPDCENYVTKLPHAPWIISSNGQLKIKSSSLKLLLGHKNKKHNYYIFLLPLLSITIPFWGFSGLDLVSPWSQPFFGLGLW